MLCGIQGTTHISLTHTNLIQSVKTHTAHTAAENVSYLTLSVLSHINTQHTKWACERQEHSHSKCMFGT